MDIAGTRVDSRGQTLVEAIVVIGVVVLLVTGLIAGTTTSMRTTRISRTRSQAVKYAQEGLEIVRTLRDTNWGAFALLAGLQCLGSDGQFTTGGGTCDPNIATGEEVFTRSVNFSWNPTYNRMEVTVMVDYPDETKVSPITLTTYFTQWK
jgi:type II secretory pathway pseudopilin PulG